MVEDIYDVKRLTAKNALRHQTALSRQRSALSKKTVAADGQRKPIRPDACPAVLVVWALWACSLNFLPGA